jgi:hypothetical protein
MRALLLRRFFRAVSGKIDHYYGSSHTMCISRDVRVSPLCVGSEDPEGLAELHGSVVKKDFQGPPCGITNNTSAFFGV